MAYATTKKQNRILMIALVVLLAAAAILIAITGSANRKKEDAPPVDETEAETKGSETSRGVSPEDSAGDAFGKTVTDGGADTSKSHETETETESTKPAAEEPDSAAVSSTVPESLPQFQLPVNGVVSKRHSVDVPVFSDTMNDYRTHTGVDIACEAGAMVVSPADGVISEVWEDPMMGISVRILHTGGAVTTFQGLAPETVESISAGDEVKAGEVVASAGDTALIECGDDTHVHMELALNGEAVDPADYIHFDFLDTTYEG